LGLALRQEIYNPIRNAVSKYQHLFVATDGELNLLPLQILPLEETGKQLLMDKYTISYLSVGRDILRQQVDIQRSASEPLVIADPDFNLGMEGEQLQPSQEHSGGLSEVATPVANLLSNLSNEHFQRVEKTRILGEGVASRLGVKSYLQAEALESHLTSKEKQCPHIMLIATHGFAQANKSEIELLQKLLDCSVEEEEKVLHEDKVLLNWDFLALMEKQVIRLTENKHLEAADKLRRATVKVTKLLQEASLNLHQDRLSARVENPMLRSGLALAGANTWRTGNTLPAEAGKGILFAQDIINLDLWVNEITVLVACRSGMGDIRVGEGVFGLRRAFAVAGSKTLIMSLWDVPEKVSVLLMQQFFDALQSGRGRAEALQAAQNYVRSISVRELQQFPLGLEILQELLAAAKKDISQVDEENRPLKHPFFWGAWICQGVTTPLSGLG
jgi:CHAT domain-containing protein